MGFENANGYVVITEAYDEKTKEPINIQELEIGKEYRFYTSCMHTGFVPIKKEENGVGGFIYDTQHVFQVRVIDMANKKVETEEVRFDITGLNIPSLVYHFDLAQGMMVQFFYVYDKKLEHPIVYLSGFEGEELFDPDGIFLVMEVPEMEDYAWDNYMLSAMTLDQFKAIQEREEDEEDEEDDGDEEAADEAGEDSEDDDEDFDEDDDDAEEDEPDIWLVSASRMKEFFETYKHIMK